jgi:hypothetical protein
MPERLVSGSFTGTGSSSTMSNHATLDSDKKMTVSVSGTFSATVDLERSYDAGSNWNVVKSYTTTAEENLDTPSDAFIYRLTCSAYTSGTVDYALAK